MTSLSDAAEVLKQDERGRLRVSRERREALLAEFDRSGMSGAKFARVTGLNYQTFVGWVRQRKLRGGAATSGAVQFLEAVVGTPAETRIGLGLAGGLQIDLPGGSVLRIESPGQLALAAELISLVAQSGRNRC